MSSIDGVKVECDEDGFHLILSGDFVQAVQAYLDDPDGYTLDLRLPQDEAIALASSVKEVVQPWIDEMEYHRAAYNRATPEERHAVLTGTPVAEPLADWADIERKRAKGE